MQLQGCCVQTLDAAPVLVLAHLEQETFALHVSHPCTLLQEPSTATGVGAKMSRGTALDQQLNKLAKFQTHPAQ